MVRIPEKLLRRGGQTEQCLANRRASSVSVDLFPTLKRMDPFPLPSTPHQD